MGGVCRHSSRPCRRRVAPNSFGPSPGARLDGMDTQNTPLPPRTPLALAFTLLALVCLPGLSLAADLQPAEGGTALPPEGGGDYTELDGPVVTESASGQIGTDQIVLELPDDFEWNTDATPQMCLTEGDNAAGQNINQKSVGDCRTADSLTAQQAVFNIDRASRRTANQLSFSGLEVRPVDGAEEAEGDISQTGSSNISGIDDPNVSWGELAQLPPGEDIILTANDEPDEATVSVDEAVDFEVFAQNCPDEERWRDTWRFGDGEEDEEIFEEPPCGFEVTNTHTYTEIGVYEAEFISEYCTNWSSFFGTCFGEWEEFGQDQVTVIVEPPEIDADTLIEYRFEESEWTGAAGEVEDGSGNGFDGTSSGGAQTTDDDPAIDEDPGTCRYGEFDPDGHIEAPLPDDLNDTESFAAGFWLRMPDQSATTPSIFAAGDLDGNYAERFEIFQRGNGNLAAVFRTGGGDEFLEVPGGEGVDEGWVHVAVVRDYYFDGNRPQADHRFYIDANLVAEENLDYPPGQSDDSLLNEADGPIQIAGYASGDFLLEGDLDEVNLFEGALDDGEVQVLRDRVFQCEPDVAYYRVTHAGQGVTCATTPVTVEARDEDDEPVEPEPGTLVSLFSDTGGGFWSTLEQGSGAFEAGNDGDASYEFPGGEAGFVAGYDYTEISTDPEEVIPQAEDQDGIGSDADTLAISRAGFRFIDRDTGDAIVPDQIAGKPSDVGEDAADLGLQAIRESDADPETCDGVYEDGETAVVELAAECRDPDECAGAGFEVNGLGIATVADNGDNTSAADYEPVELTFGPQSTAPISLVYPDAGAMRLYALAEIERGDEEPSGDFITGASNESVWRPFAFHVDIDGVPDESPAPDGTSFRVAGEGFDAGVRAVIWDPDDDTDGDGRPDDDADLSGNPVTPNFGNEADPPEAFLSVAVAAPEEGADGTITDGAGNTPVYDQFQDGEAPAQSILWTETGYADITAELSGGDYLGAGGVFGTHNEVGRFIADQYTVSENESGELAVGDYGCTEGDDAYNPIRDPMPWSLQPELEITPVNAEGDTVSNMDDFSDQGGDNWWRLTALSSDDIDYADEAKPDTLRLDTAAAEIDPDFNLDNVDNGRGYFRLDGELGHDWDHDQTPAPDEPPFPIDLRATVPISDPDDVAYQAGGDPDENDYVLESITTEDDAEQRHVRLAIADAHGSELLDLAVPTRSEYYAGDEQGWIQNEEDACTSGVSLTRTSGSLDAGTTCAIEPGNESGIGCGESGDPDRYWTEPPELPNGGDFNLWLQAPGEGNTGDLRLDVDNQPTPFEYDWRGEGNHDQADNAVITFGIFQGIGRQIDRREVR